MYESEKIQNQKSYLYMVKDTMCIKHEKYLKCQDSVKFIFSGYK